MSVYLKPNELEKYFKKYSEILKEKGLTDEQIVKKMQKQAKDEVIMIYTKEFMDDNLQYWIKTILEVKGGYWIVQDLIHQPHCEYEHYSWKGKMSYEKGNVSDSTARRELTPRNYEIYQLSKKLKKQKEYIEANINQEILIKKIPDLENKENKPKEEEKYKDL